MAALSAASAILRTPKPMIGGHNAWTGLNRVREGAGRPGRDDRPALVPLTCDQPEVGTGGALQAVSLDYRHRTLRAIPRRLRIACPNG